MGAYHPDLRSSTPLDAESKLARCLLFLHAMALTALINCTAAGSSSPCHTPCATGNINGTPSSWNTIEVFPSMRDIVHACSMFRVRIPTAKGTLYNILGGPTILCWFVRLDRSRWISRDTIEKADMESRNRNSFCWKLISISYIGWTRGSVQRFTTRIPEPFAISALRVTELISTKD
jgi:hypothetical protein